MKKVEQMRAGYRRKELGKGVRGKHYAEFRKGDNRVLLKPELAKILSTNEVVNAVLDSLVGVARSAAGVARRSAARRAKASRVD